MGVELNQRPERTPRDVPSSTTSGAWCVKTPWRKNWDTIPTETQRRLWGMPPRLAFASPGANPRVVTSPDSNQHRLRSHLFFYHGFDATDFNSMKRHEATQGLV